MMSDLEEMAIRPAELAKSNPLQGVHERQHPEGVTLRAEILFWRDYEIQGDLGFYIFQGFMKIKCVTYSELVLDEDERSPGSFELLVEVDLERHRNAKLDR